MVPPTSGRLGAVKAGTGISIGVDGTICATGGGGGGVFSADAENNIWSCTTSLTADGAADNFLVGLCAGANLTGSYSYGNTFIGKYAGFCGGSAYNNFFVGERAGEQLSDFGSNNNFFGYKAGGNTIFGYNNNFIGKYAGQNEGGVCNTYIGKYAGKGVDGTLGRITYWTIDSSTVIPGVYDDYPYYSISVYTAGGTYIYGTLVRDFTGDLTEGSDSFLASAFGPIVDGEVIVIPGNQIGGSSPADDATITLYADFSGLYNRANISLGNYSASENYGDSWQNLSIGAYAGQYTGFDEFNHIFIGSSAGRFATGGFYNVYIGAYAGESAGGTSSFSNTFIGTFTGRCAANSFYQTHVGAYSGKCVVHPLGWTGIGNQLFGAFSGAYLTTGVANSMFGSYAGYNTTTGTYNSFFGVDAGQGLTTGSYNVAFGAFAAPGRYYDPGFTGPSGWRCSSGGCNTNIGSWSGHFQPGSSSCNVAVGNESNSGTVNGISSLLVSPATTLPSAAYCSYVISTNCISVPGFPNQPPGYPGTVKVTRNGAGTVCKIEVIDPGKCQQCRTYTCVPGSLIGGTNGVDNLTITSRTLTSSPPDTCSFNNTYIGPFAGQMSFYGCRNFFGGFRAGGWSGDYSTDNVAIGSYAGFCMGGAYNIAIGCCAGALSEGYRNLIIGEVAGRCNQGWFTTLIGGCAGYYNQADGSTFIGQDAGVYNTTGQSNTFVGSGAGEQNTTGFWNSFFGAGAGGNVTTGEGNTFVGAGTAQVISTGSRNVAVGCWAMQSAGQVSNNVAVGHCAFRGFSNLPGCDWNIAIGSETLTYGSLGTVVIGGCSLSRVRGCCSTAVGYFALKGTGDGTTYLTNSGNSVFGWCSTVGITTGSENSAFGLFSGLANSSGSFNTFFGSRSGCSNTTGGNNVAIGWNAGTDAVLNLTTQSNQIVIGNNSHTNAFVKVGWTVTSDERDKTCVTSVRHGLDFLDQITPVQYNWKNRETEEITDETPRYGFLAQDILAAEGDPAILVDTQDPENLKLRESMMIPVLVQAIKELHEEVKALKQLLQP